MKLGDDIEFPVKLTDPEEGKVEFFDSVGHLETNLEEVNSRDDSDCRTLTDALGRKVFLTMHCTFIEVLRIEPEP